MSSSSSSSSSSDSSKSNHSDHNRKKKKSKKNRKTAKVVSVKLPQDAKVEDLLSQLKLKDFKKAEVDGRQLSEKDLLAQYGLAANSQIRIGKKIYSVVSVECKEESRLIESEEKKGRKAKNNQQTLKLQEQISVEHRDPRGCTCTCDCHFCKTARSGEVVQVQRQRRVLRTNRNCNCRKSSPKRQLNHQWRSSNFGQECGQEFVSNSCRFCTGGQDKRLKVRSCLECYRGPARVSKEEVVQLSIVNEATGSECDVLVHEFTLVSRLKEHISLRKQIPVEKFELFHDEEILKPTSETLAAFGIGDGCSLVLKRRSCVDYYGSRRQRGQYRSQSQRCMLEYYDHDDAAYYSSSGSSYGSTTSLNSFTGCSCDCVRCRDYRCSMRNDPWFD